MPVRWRRRAGQGERLGRPCLGYVVPELSARSTQHFAHSRHLVEILGADIDITVIVERGDAPAHLPGATCVLAVQDGSRAPRVWRVLRAVLLARRMGVDTFFLRYSRTFTLVLLAVRPVLGHRIFYWRSGMADMQLGGGTRDVRAIFKRRLDDAVNRSILRSVDKVVTGPETMVAWTASRWRLDPSRVHLLYNDIDPDRFVPLPDADRQVLRSQLGWPSKTFVVLFVHHLSFRRGTRLLADIAERLEGAGRKIELLVVGDGPDRPLLEEQARIRAGCLVTLRVVGPIPNADLAPYFAGADAFLMPSYEEGFPRVVLEAMASGVIVVTTDAGGTADLVGHDYPYLRPTGDWEGLADCVRDIAAMPASERQQVGTRNRTRVAERFATSVVARQYLGLLS